MVIVRDLVLLIDCNTDRSWAVVVVKWSACSPSLPTIRVRIPLKPTIFSVKLCLKRTKINKKEAGEGTDGPLASLRAT